MPRMRTLGAEPVMLPGSTTTPGALATMRSERLVTGACSTFRLMSPRVWTELPSSTLRCWPVAVVTTSVSLTTACAIVKSMEALPLAATVTGFFCSV